MKKWVAIVLTAAVCIIALYGIMLGVFYLKITEKSDRELWRITDYSFFDPVAVNDLLIFSGHRADRSIDCDCDYVYGANKSTGEIVWSTEEIEKTYMNSGVTRSSYFYVDPFIEMVSPQKEIVYFSLYYTDAADNLKSALIAVRSNDGKLLWKIDGVVNSDSFAKSVLEKDQIFVIDEQGALLTINSDTGKEIWRHNFYFRPDDADIWLDYYKDTVFYFDSQRGQKINAFDAKTGQSLWESAQLDSSSKIYIFDQTIYAVPSPPSGNRLVTALDLETGKKRWETAFYNGDEFSMAAGEKNEVVFLIKKYEGKENVHKLAQLVVDEFTGQPLWKFNDSFSRGDLGYLINDGTMYIGTEDGFVYSLDSATGKIVWQNETGYFPIQFVVDGNALIVVYKEKYVSVLDSMTGLQKWRSDLGVDESWSVLGEDILRVNGNTILVIGNNDQKIYALDINTGNELWSWGHFLPTRSTYYVRLLDEDTLYVNQWPHWDFFVPDYLIGNDWYFALKVEP